jgi:hypothetical protein
MAEELLTIQVASSSREDTILMQEGMARVERGLILRGAESELFENGRIIIISVNGHTFNTLEELVAILLKLGNGPLRLTESRKRISSSRCFAQSNLPEDGGKKGLRLEKEKKLLADVPVPHHKASDILTRSNQNKQSEQLKS